MSFWTLFVFILCEGACVCACVCMLSLHAYWPLHTVTCTQSIQKPVCTVNKNCILIWQHAVSVFLCVRLQFYDVRVVDHLVTVSQGALGNHDRHFLKAERRNGLAMTEGKGATAWSTSFCHEGSQYNTKTLDLLSSIYKCSEEVILAHL